MKASERQAKQARALQLRMAGQTFAEIAEQLGYSGPSGALQAVRAAQRRASGGESTPLDALLLEAERIQLAIRGLASGVDQGDIAASRLFLAAAARATEVAAHIAAVLDSEEPTDTPLAQVSARAQIESFRRVPGD